MKHTNTFSTKRWRFLLTGFLLLLALGLIYAWSVIGAPIAEQFGWSASQSSTVFSVSMVCFCLGGILGSLLSKKCGERITLMISAVCMLAGCLLTVCMTKHVGFCISYGLLCGTGVGLSYNVLLGAVGAWYPDKPGLCSGVLLMGFGLGGLILGTAASEMEGMLGWQTTFIIFAAMFSIFLLAGAFLIRRPAETEIVLPAACGNGGRKPDGAEMSTRQMLRRPTFWRYFVWAVCFNGIGLAVIGQARQIAISGGTSVEVAVTLVGIVSVCNGLGRIIFGGIYDRKGARATTLLITATFLLALVLLLVTVKSTTLWLLILSFALIGAAYGGTPATNAAFVNHMYGKQNYASNLGVINMTIIPASLAGPAIASLVMDRTGSYTGAFMIFIVIALAIAWIPFFITKP